jgi:probable rRNA maturation factor
VTASGALKVHAYDETSEGTADLDRWCELARSTLEAEGAGDGRLDLIFVDPPAMAELNRQHLGQDRPTDVLAFPLDGPDPQSGPVQSDPLRHIGDVVVCPAVARAQASGHCGAYEPELTLLVVHGVLHVLGHDHADEGERLVMQARERHHLGRHGYTHPVPA